MSPRCNQPVCVHLDYSPFIVFFVQILVDKIGNECVDEKNNDGTAGTSKLDPFALLAPSFSNMLQD